MVTKEFTKEERELFGKLKYLIKKQNSFEDICSKLEISSAEMMALMDYYSVNGYTMKYENGVILFTEDELENSERYEIPTDLQDLKLCMISDTHLCSKADRLDILEYIYEKCDKRGIDIVLHSGDFTDGFNKKRNYAKDLKETSYDGQVDYCVEKYPVFGGTTYAISGNHDDWWYYEYDKNGNLLEQSEEEIQKKEIVRSIAEKRDDIVYLGRDCADLKIGLIDFRLYHKTNDKPMTVNPQIIQSGHIHQSAFTYDDRTKSYKFQVSGLIDETPYSRRRKYKNEKSCWWLDISYDDYGNIYHITQELESFSKKLTPGK